jgi:hypothetical protein
MKRSEDDTPGGSGGGDGGKWLPHDAVFFRFVLAPYRSRFLSAVRTQNYVRSAHFAELAVAGLPGVKHVAVFVWPDPVGFPDSLLVDVVRVGATPLKIPISFSFPLVEGEKMAGPRANFRETPPPGRPWAPPDSPRTGDTPRTTVVTAAKGATESGNVPESPLPSTRRPESIRVRGPDGPITWHLVEHLGIASEVVRLDRDGTPVYHSVDTHTRCYAFTCRCGRVRYAPPNGLHQIGACWVCTRAARLRRRALAQYVRRYGQPR